MEEGLCSSPSTEVPAQSSAPLSHTSAVSLAGPEPGHSDSDVPETASSLARD
jgi:hypothetical protein